MKRNDRQPFYEIVGEKIVNQTTYKLIKNRLQEVSRAKRKKFLEKIMNNENAYGLIKWWSKGSIVNKSRREFYLILLCARIVTQKQLTKS